MMKRLPILLLFVMLGSGCQNNSREQAAKETEAKPLTPIPDEVTVEFVRELWNQPHEETGVIDQVKQYMRPGKWKILRTFAPNGGTPLSTEISREVKYVDRRFLVFQYRVGKFIDEGTFSQEGGEGVGVIAYDFEDKVLKCWEFVTVEGHEGLDIYLTGEPDSTFKNITWKSHKMPKYPPGSAVFVVQNIDDARERLVSEGRMLKGNETIGLIQDEMTLLEKPGPGS